MAATRFALRGGPGASLADVVRRAATAGVDDLVVSSEDLDRVRREDIDRVAEAWAGHRVDVLLTVTRPVHRWCSGWQELVKHGLADYPRDAAPFILRFAALDDGRLAEIISLLNATRTVVRLVRVSPPEPQLPHDAAALMDLPVPRSSPEAHAPISNPSLGPDVEVVLRLTRAGRGLGADRLGRAALRALRAEGFTYHESDALAALYSFPPQLSSAARSEAAWLAAPPPGVEVWDPHRLLAEWAELTPPEWYARISRTEARLPGVEDLGLGTGEEQWRERQRRAAVQARRRVVESRSVSG
jgi:hypothetical protein